MNKIWAILILMPFFFHTVTYSQVNKFTAQSNDLLLNEILIQNELSNFEGFSFDGKALYNYLKEKPATIKMELELGSNIWNIELTRSTIIAPSAKMYILGPSGSKLQMNPPEILTFHGKIQDINGSGVTITALDDYIHIVIHSTDDSFVFQAACLYNKNLSRNDYVLYSGSDSKEVLATCGMVTDNVRVDEEEIQSRSFTVGDVHKVKLAIASDYAMFLEKGSIEGVTLHAVTVMNNVANNYEYTDGGPNFDEGVQYEIVEQIVSICPDCDPWTDATDSEELIGDFRNWAQNGGFNTEHDMGSLWTDRDFDGSTVGRAYQFTNLVCGNSAYQVLQDYTNNQNLLRSLVSHELGHNWSGTHDASSGNIMAPSISNTNSWSANSKSQIGGEIAAQGVLCLESESTISCSPVSDVIVSNITTTSVTISWNHSGGTSKVRIRIREEGSGTYLSTTTTSSTSITLTPPLQLCKTYHIIVERDCGGGDYSAAEGAIFNSSYETDFVLISLDEINCPETTHDIQLVVEHGGGNASGFNVNIGGMNYPQVFSVSPQTITITGLANTGTTESVLISANINGGGECDLSSSYSAPANCLLFEVINLNNCLIPEGWVVTTTTALDFDDPFAWKVGGGSRAISNYFSNTLSPTINGTCMFYMDDDVNNSTDFMGTTTLTSPVYDLTGIATPVLNFTYNFHKFEEKSADNNSEFLVEVYDGALWVEVLSDTDDVCAWNKVWIDECETQISINLSANPDFQVRFVYTDSGSWTGMIALDDIVIADAQALPIELINFSGTNAGNINLLTWQTASEINNDHFDIERSPDGQSFDKIGEKKGHGTTSSVKNYEYIDNQPYSGINYYRLRQVDFDGNYEYSPIRSVIMDVDKWGEGDLQVSYYPNPVSNNLSIVTNTNVTDYELRVMDMTGQLIDRIDYTSGMILPMASYLSGVYLLQLINKDGHILSTQNIVKIED